MRAAYLMANVVSDLVPEGLTTWGGEIVDQVRESPGLQRLLVVIGIVTAVIFVVGVIKQAFKAAIIGGILCVAAWLGYLIVR